MQTKVKVTVLEEILTDTEADEYTQFKVAAPVIIYKSRGQRGKYGVPLEPDEQGVDIHGNIEITNVETDESMEEQEFLDRHGKQAEQALERFHEDRERLYERASEIAGKQQEAAI